MLFKRHFIKKRLKRLKKLQVADPYRRNLQPQIDLLLFKPPSNLFKDYRHQRGKTMEVISIHNNAERLLNIVDSSRASVVVLGTLPSQSQADDTSATIVTLDMWLRTNDHYPVKPEVACTMLYERVGGLLKSIEECGSQPYARSYRRKLTYVFLDYITIMEALLKAAL